MYATPLKLLLAIGAAELTRLIAPTSARVTVETEALIEAACRGADLVGYSPAEQAIAADALARAQQAIDQVAGWIDDHLRGRYTLPLTVVPSYLSALAVDATIYRLLRKPNEDQVRRQEAAEKTLRMIARGELTIGAAGTAPATTGGGDTAVVSAPPSPWGDRSDWP